MIRIRSKKLSHNPLRHPHTSGHETASKRALAALLAGVIALAGCSGDDSEPSDTVDRVYRAPTTGQTAPEDVPVNPAPTTPAETAPASPPPTTPPENPPDEGGDEEPARTELEFRGTSSGVKPRQAGVAPYISVKVTLTSEDGSSHTLTIDGHTAKVGGSRTSAFFTLPGLRPGRSYRGTADGKPIRILSTSEPGP